MLSQRVDLKTKRVTILTHLCEYERLSLPYLRISGSYTTPMINPEFIVSTTTR